MTGVRITKTFNFCCTRLLSSQYNLYVKTGKKPERMQVSCIGNCPRDYRLGEFSIVDQSFFFNYNNWWYVFDMKENSIEPFYPTIGVYDKDPDIFASNLVKEDLLSKLGVRLLFGEISQEEYVNKAMVHYGYDKSTMLDDYGIIIKFRLWNSLTIEKNKKINKYKEMAVSLLNG